MPVEERDPNEAGQGAPSSLTPRDRYLALRLAAGASQVEAARELGISDRTVRRRASSPAFVALLDEERQRLIEAARDRAAELQLRALDALDELLDAKRETTRLGAARTAIQAGRTMRLMVDDDAGHPERRPR